MKMNKFKKKLLSGVILCSSLLTASCGNDGTNADENTIYF